MTCAETKTVPIKQVTSTITNYSAPVQRWQLQGVFQTVHTRRCWIFTPKLQLRMTCVVKTLYIVYPVCAYKGWYIMDNKSSANYLPVCYVLLCGQRLWHDMLQDCAAIESMTGCLVKGQPSACWLEGFSYLRIFSVTSTTQQLYWPCRNWS